MIRKKDPGLIIAAQYFRELEKLTGEYIGKTVRSLLMYMGDLNMDEPELSPCTSVLYGLLRADVDTTTQRD